MNWMVVMESWLLIAANVELFHSSFSYAYQISTFTYAVECTISVGVMNTKNLSNCYSSLERIFHLRWRKWGKKRIIHSVNCSVVTVKNYTFEITSENLKKQRILLWVFFVHSIFTAWVSRTQNSNEFREN